MTVPRVPAMITKARTNAAKSGFANVEFRLGEGEAEELAAGAQINVATPRSRARLPTRASWSVQPSSASTSSNATSARSSAWTVINALTRSARSARLPARRSPAVSTSV